jgi:arylsulfatase A
MTGRLCWVLSLLLAFTGFAGEESSPNIILMMADDLGYNDLSCYGSQKLRTPVLDKLAEEGLRLTDFYAGATVCTPSRMALLTGAYPSRLGWNGGVVGYRIKPINGLAPEARTMGEVFRDAGYRTGLIGKWHLGDTAELHPQKQGFEETYFIDKSNNQTKKLWRGSELIVDPFDNRRLTENFISEAIQFIRSNKKNPFFLYLPFTAPHFPAQAHPEWEGKSKNAAYGDVVEELDGRIGDLLKVLEDEKLKENTIVVFISDNGTEPGQKKWGSAYPFRGMKWSALEGGTRVPCIIRYPGAVPEGKVSDKLTSAIDLLPTVAHACGIDLTQGSGFVPKVDGLILWDSLCGKTKEHPRSNLLYLHGWATPQAIRVNEWKLYFDKIKEIERSDLGPVLIDLSMDPAENVDRSKEFPARVKSMLALARELLQGLEQDRVQLGGPQVKLEKIKQARWLN